jgi:hypothetical protein
VGAKCNTHNNTLIHIICEGNKCNTCMIIYRCTLYVGAKCNIHIMTLIHTICGSPKCNTYMFFLRCTLYMGEKWNIHIMTLIQYVVKGNAIHAWQFMDGGVSTNATLKPRHTSINWILPWGIKTLVIFGNKRASRSTNWLVSVKIHNNDCKTLHAHNWNEKTRVHKK